MSRQAHNKHQGIKVQDDLATLTDIDTVEVSLVDSGAVARTFNFRKRDANMALDIIKAIAGTKLEKESDVTTALQKAGIDDPDVRESLMTALKLLQANRDQLTDAQMSQLLAAAGAPTADPDNQPDANSDSGEGDGDTNKGADDGKGDDDSEDDDSKDDDDKNSKQQKRNKQVAKQNAELNQRFEDLQKQSKADKAELAELRKGFTAERDKRLEAEAIDLAKSKFKQMGAPADFGGIIRKAQKAGVWADLEPLFATLNERLAKSALFSEAGHAAPGTGGDDDTKIEGIAKGLREKDPKLSVAKSKSLAWQTPEGREIYKRQDAERTNR